MPTNWERDDAQQRWVLRNRDGDVWAFITFDALLSADDDALFALKRELTWKLGGYPPEWDRGGKGEA